MNAASPHDYLEQKIKTASSAQLHLMLIEGAIRFAQQADQAYLANNAEAAAVPLKRAMDIASELLAGVKHSQDEVNVKLAQLYQFIFTRLTMAYVNTDREKLAEAVSVLEYERETWRQACDQAAGNGEPQAAGDAPKAEAPKGPHKPVSLPAANLASEGGLSLEA